MEWRQVTAIQTALSGRDFGDACSGMLWMMTSVAIRFLSHDLGQMYRRTDFSCMSENGSDLDSQVVIQQVTWLAVCKASLGQRGLSNDMRIECKDIMYIG